MTTSRGQQIVLAARPKGKPEFFINYDFAAEHYADFPREVAAGIARVAFATVRTSSIVDGLESAPGGFIGMLEGRNFGKLIVRVAA
jgi:NADPH-dependent curcumin reductase CurA